MEPLSRKDILKLRISLLFVRDKYTFLNTLTDFQNRLSLRFTERYCQDEIENALYELEEQFLEHKESVIEIPEDYKLN